MWAFFAFFHPWQVLTPLDEWPAHFLPPSTVSLSPVSVSTPTYIILWTWALGPSETWSLTASEQRFLLCNEGKWKVQQSPCLVGPSSRWFANAGVSLIFVQPANTLNISRLQQRSSTPSMADGCSVTGSPPRMSGVKGGNCPDAHKCTILHR